MGYYHATDTRSTNMNWSKLQCPQCQSRYPLVRLYARYWSHKCPECHARLAFSPKSSARCGAALGLTFSVVMMPPVLIVSFALGLDHFTAHWPPYFIAVAVISYVVSPLVFSQVGELIPYEQARRTRWRDIFKI